MVVLWEHDSLQALAFGPVPQAHSGVIGALVIVDADKEVSLCLLPGSSRAEFDFSHLVLVGA